MLSLGFEEIGEIGFLKLTGSIDGTTYRMFHAAANGLLDQGISRIVLDLSEVDFIVSSGFRTIGGCISGAKDMGGNVVVLRPTAEVLEILRLLGFHNLVTIAETREEAIRALTPDGEAGEPGGHG